MALRKYDKEWLEELCKDSFSLAEVLKKAGRKQGGGAQETLKKKILEFGIDTSHFTGQGWSRGKTKDTDSRISSRERYSIEDIFIEQSPYTRSVARDYIIRHELIPYSCAFCGNTGIWRGKKIALQLDHINGVNNDHRLNNLRWLCPNCHATTDTFSGKNAKQEISLDEVKNAIEATGNFCAKDICIYLGRSVNGSNLNKIKLLGLQLGYE